MVGVCGCRRGFSRRMCFLNRERNWLRRQPWVSLPLAAGTKAGRKGPRAAAIVTAWTCGRLGFGVKNGYRNRDSKWSQCPGARFSHLCPCGAAGHSSSFHTLPRHWANRSVLTLPLFIVYVYWLVLHCCRHLFLLVLPLVRYVAAAAASGMILFGGGFCSPCAGQAGTSRSDVVDLFNVTSGVWTTHRLSERRSNLAATSVGDRWVLFIGGTTDVSPLPGGKVRRSDAVDIYDAHTGAWATTRLSSGRCCLGAAGEATTAAVLGSGSMVDVFSFAAQQ